jgi:cysteine desulfurase
MKKIIYLDNGATTIVDEKVITEINKYNSYEYGNASSIHEKGEKARKAVDKAREIIAKSIQADKEEIIFTSGGTESNNLTIKGIAFSNNKGKNIIISKIEHDCILKSCEWLKSQGYNIFYLDVDKEGFVIKEQLKKLINKDTILVSIIHGNNEIGTIQNLEEIYNICKEKKVLFHTDACQSYTKTSLSSIHADLITLNSHKIHGPKGVGALYIKKGIKITPLFHGGGHEFNIRSGTENVSGILGFAKTVELSLKDKDKNIKKMNVLRDYFIDNVLRIKDSILNGPTKNKRLCNNINVSFRYIEGESVVMDLNRKGIYVSTGSACSSHTLDPSHVIIALEKNHERAHGSIRFTISKYTTKDEIDYTLLELKKTVDKLRKLSPLGGN